MNTSTNSTLNQCLAINQFELEFLVFIRMPYFMDTFSRCVAFIMNVHAIADENIGLRGKQLHFTKIV
jgi:hypothetical protein